MRRFQFRLVSLFSVLFLSSLVAWQVGSVVDIHREEHAVAARLKVLGAHVRAEPMPPALLPFCRDLEIWNRITTLDANESQVTDAHLEQIGKLRCLKVLALSYCRVTDQGLAEIEHLPLNVLHLRGTRITDAGLAHLKRMPMSYLNITATRCNGSGFAHLHTSPIKKLDADWTLVDDKGLELLSGFQELEILTISSDRITDAGLRRLERLPRLETLVIGSDGITDAGVERLAKKPSLKTFRFYGARITEKCAARIQDARKDLDIGTMGSTVLVDEEGLWLLPP